MREKHIKRREFLAWGMAAAAGSGLAAVPTQAADKPQATGFPDERTIGLFTSAGTILRNPKYVDALQEKLGVNVLLCSVAAKLPDRLVKMNPLGPDQRFYVSHTEDDSEAYRLVEEVRRRGMKLWLRFEGHHHGEAGRPIIAETFEGVKFLDLPRVRYSLESQKAICFSKPIVKEYGPQVYAYGAKTYEPDSMITNHFRYTNPSYWPNLFGCACQHCQDEAVNMGYNFPRMKRAMLSLRSRLEKIDRKQVEYAAKSRFSFADFLTFLGDDDGVNDWFVFRAKVVGNQLRRINKAVRAETGGRCGLINSSYNPTLSMYVGHRYADLLSGASDALYTTSWCDSQHIGAVTAWANQLCTWVPGLEESTALKVVTRFFGWDELGLPTERIHEVLGLKSPDEKYTKEAFYNLFNPDLTVNLLTHEWSRMMAINNGRLPTLAMLKGDVFSEKVCRELMDRGQDLGLNGFVFQNTDSLIDRNKL